MNDELVFVTVVSPSKFDTFLETLKEAVAYLLPGPGEEYLWVGFVLGLLGLAVAVACFIGLLKALPVDDATPTKPQPPKEAIPRLPDPSDEGGRKVSTLVLLIACAAILSCNGQSLTTFCLVAAVMIVGYALGVAKQK